MVVVKKPGGGEMVLDIPADFETVSGIDDEKYAITCSLSCHRHYTDFCFSCCHDDVSDNNLMHCSVLVFTFILTVHM